MPALFQTQRNKVLDLYSKAGQPFIASTQPYHSTRTLRWHIVDVDITNGVAFAVARDGQNLDFFTYGVGDRITLGSVANLAATEAETNLAKGKSTNGASDFIIEGVGMHARAMCVTYADSSSPMVIASDTDVLAGLAGQLPIIDPASIVMPPQGQSPANLEEPLFQSVMPFLSLEFEWDRKRTEKLGVCDILPQAGARSYLRTNGDPRSDNRYRIPEGYIWRRDGEPDGEFAARVSLERTVICPINLRALLTNPATFKSPDYIDVELVMRVYGLEVQLPSAN